MTAMGSETTAAHSQGWGTGRAWPLLTGERGHYELAAGRDVGPYVRAIERFATAAGLLPEQVWDAPDRPEARMQLGRPTGAAMPLMWAHAEYIKLLRSARDGQVFDRIPSVVERYQGSQAQLADRGMDVPAPRSLGPGRHDPACPRQGAVSAALDGRRVVRCHGH